MAAVAERQGNANYDHDPIAVGSRAASDFVFVRSKPRASYALGNVAKEKVRVMNIHPVL